MGLEFDAYPHFQALLDREFYVVTCVFLDEQRGLIQRYHGRVFLGFWIIRIGYPHDLHCRVVGWIR